MVCKRETAFPWVPTSPSSTVLARPRGNGATGCCGRAGTFPSDGRPYRLKVTVVFQAAVVAAAAVAAAVVAAATAVEAASIPGAAVPFCRDHRS